MMNNIGEWPNERLIAPFFGRLNLEQIYSPEDPVLPVASTNPLSKYMVPSDVSESDDVACGSSASPS
jgi:hypothetical protein